MNNSAASCVHKSPAPASAKEEADSDNHVDGEQRRPWADIASPLLDHLLPRVCLIDRARLSAVCRRWHDSLADHPSLRRPEFPWMIRRSIYITDDSAYEIFCLTEDGRFTLPLPAIYKHRKFRAAAHGWLLFMEYQGISLRRFPNKPSKGKSIRGFSIDPSQGRSIRGFLINPRTKACIALPASPRFYDEAALSAAPTEPGCIVIHLIRCGVDNWEIYDCRIGDMEWQVRREQFCPWSNITAVDGKFYVLCKEGLAEMDFDQSCLYPFRWINMNNDVFTGRSKNSHFLVESNGELLLITLLLMIEYPDLSGYWAHVHKADLKNRIWARVENLAGRSLFLSEGSCFSLPAPATDARGHADAGGGRIYATFKEQYSDQEVHWGEVHWREYKVCPVFMDQLPLHAFRLEEPLPHYTWFNANYLM